MAPNDGVDISGTVRERAARELRDRILTGALPAGTRLDLDAITKEFATSRTPVREALLELSYDGLVRVAPRSGITVIGISPEDVLDSFTILGVLTGQAAAWAARAGHRGRHSSVAAPGRRRRSARRGRRHRRGELAFPPGDPSGGAFAAIDGADPAGRPRRPVELLRDVPRPRAQLAGRSPGAGVGTRPTATPRKPVHIAERHVLDAGRSLAEWLEQNDRSRVVAPRILCDRRHAPGCTRHTCDFHEARIRPAGSDFAVHTAVWRWPFSAWVQAPPRHTNTGHFSGAPGKRCRMTRHGRMRTWFGTWVSATPTTSNTTCGRRLRPITGRGPICFRRRSRRLPHLRTRRTSPSSAPDSYPSSTACLAFSRACGG